MEQKKQNQKQNQQNKQQQKKIDGFIDELDGKYVEVVVSYGSTTQRMRGTLRVARYDVKLEVLDSRTQKITNVYINKAFLISVVPV